MCHAIHFHRMFVWVPTNFDPCSCTRSHLYILIKHWHFYDDSSQCQRQNIRLLCWAKNRDSIILSKRFICTNIIVGNTPISIFAAWDTVQRRHAVLSIALFLCRATKSRQKLFLDSVQIEINLSALLLFLPSPETVSLVKVFSARGQPQRPPSHLKVHTASYHFWEIVKFVNLGVIYFSLVLPWQPTMDCWRSWVDLKVLGRNIRSVVIRLRRISNRTWTSGVYSRFFSCCFTPHHDHS